MANRAKRVQKNLENEMLNRQKIIASSLVGSIIIVVEAFKGRPFNIDSLWSIYIALQKDKDFKPENISDAIDKIAERQNVNRNILKENLCLVYDDKNLYSPLVCFYVNVDDAVMPMPLLPDGSLTGILNHLESDNVQVELLNDLS